MNFISRKLTRIKRWYIVNQDNIERITIVFLIVLATMLGILFTFTVINDMIYIIYEAI